MLTEQEVRRIAVLARIELTDKEVQKFQKELGDVFAYFQILQDAAVTGVEPMIHAVALKNITRKDEARSFEKDTASSLLRMTPVVKDKLVQVKSIL
jgi:aspartyl-tRNA(Asn)/glutamyl-tRNA(Gln) amidotransferase subunit C